MVPSNMRKSLSVSLTGSVNQCVQRVLVLLQAGYLLLQLGHARLGHLELLPRVMALCVGLAHLHVAPQALEGDSI